MGGLDMIKKHDKQNGMTALGVLFILLLIAFFTLLVLRLAPPYLDHFSVTSSLKSLQQEAGIKEKAPAQIYSLLQRRLDINDVKNVKKEHIKISKDRKTGLLTVSIDYEVRVPILMNVDAVVKFADSVRLASN